MVELIFQQVRNRGFSMAILIMLLILFTCYIIENDKLSDEIRTASLGVVALIVIIFIIFGIVLD